MRSPQLLNIDYTSTNEVDGGLLFDVTPNPGLGIFNLTMQTQVTGNLQMTVYNAIGQVVHEFRSSSLGTVQEVLDRLWSMVYQLESGERGVVGCEAAGGDEIGAVFDGSGNAPF
ncbi:MAG: hypothetical protein R2788_26965 [Saprospiraceae bacterium]